MLIVDATESVESLRGIFGGGGGRGRGFGMNGLLGGLSAAGVSNGIALSSGTDGGGEEEEVIERTEVMLYSWRRYWVCSASEGMLL
jgi:hypothetical protein